MARFNFNKILMFVWLLTLLQVSISLARPPGLGNERRSHHLHRAGNEDISLWPRREESAQSEVEARKVKKDKAAKPEPAVTVTVRKTTTTSKPTPSEKVAAEKRAKPTPLVWRPGGWHAPLVGNVGKLKQENTSSAEPIESTETVSVITTVVPSSGTVVILPTQTGEPTNTGFIPPFRATSGAGYITSQPIITSPIPSPTSLIEPTETPPVDNPAPPEPTNTMAGPNIFAHPVSTDPPPSQIIQKKDHPAPRIGISSTGAPIGTNKFYGNFFLGNQTSPTYLHPYSVSWARGQGASGTWGLAISHVEPFQRVYGKTDATTGAASYFINPVGIHSVCISANELGPSTVLTTENHTDWSVQVSLRQAAQGPAVIQFPLVQGSAFVTAVYNGGQPLIQTGVFFKTVTRPTRDVKSGVTKYKLHLEDGTVWLVYAYHTRGDGLNLQVVNNGQAMSTGPFYGILQVAKDPGNGSEQVLDQACGVYPTGVTLEGKVDGQSAEYKMKFGKSGMSYGTGVAMYALPHHVSSFDDATRGKVVQGARLNTTTKGVANLVVADEWRMVEQDVPSGLGFLPWVEGVGGVSEVSAEVKEYVRNVAIQEASQDMLQQSDQNSMYFSGKALAKFAGIILALHDIIGDEAMAFTALNQLKLAFARFAENQQQFPLVYESGWGGVVSSATYVTGNSGADFGNSYYNDHHFHYGYFIYTAAVIGHLDPSWIPENKAWVNMLVRDIANPSTQDQYFPVWRCFDWYHGHSWAHGLFDTLDGKDQESSSEDTMHAYALKMWGDVVGDADLAARGSLMLAVQARSLNAYYLYSSNNTIQPANFIGNKVAGILFENKVDHTTYFGANIEYIQGIHMLPLLPHTPLIRKPDFVREEWETYFAHGRAERISGGWKGILFANYATIDPRGAFEFFASEDFDPGWLDGGASLTWYLVYSAALGGL
ncbi:glycosyl hydrolase family 81-domain-containing protein [Cladorrhinum sp. PSN332]|nr:glycosyl hydrolase family 81-domain-containing protein [Cladorrhinum sp. PSN332]